MPLGNGIPPKDSSLRYRFLFKIQSTLFLSLIRPQNWRTPIPPIYVYRASYFLHGTFFCVKSPSFIHLSSQFLGGYDVFAIFLLFALSLNDFFCSLLKCYVFFVLQFEPIYASGSFW